MLKFLESPELLLQRGAVVLKFGKNFVFRSEIASFDRYMPPAKNDCKKIIESYTSPLKFYYGVETGILMP